MNVKAIRLEKTSKPSTLQPSTLQPSLVALRTIIQLLMFQVRFLANTYL